MMNLYGNLMEENVDKNELLKFFNYYSKKEFKGVMDVSKLWNRWITNAKAA